MLGIVTIFFYFSPLPVSKSYDVLFRRVFLWFTMKDRCTEKSDYGKIYMKIRQFYLNLEILLNLFCFALLHVPVLAVIK